MKWLSIITLAVLLGAFGIACADETDDAITEVFVRVVANMAVNPGAPFVDLGDVQSDLVTGCIPFTVDANTQTSKFYACASHLYKGDDPTNTDVPPILLFEAAGIDFSAPNANPTGGADGNAEYDCTSCDINGFPGFCTEWIEFESSQNNHFSQTVTICVTWNQDDDEKPMGEYSGYVSFYGMIVLP
jgi:hypothetical protein